METQAYAIQRAAVESAVYEHLQGLTLPVSGLKFVNSSGQHGNWGTCPSAFSGIRIRIADERPRSYVGRQLVRDATGQAYSPPTPIGPTDMTLNFDFIQAFAFCSPDKEHCIRAIAVHEFLHAVGFLHEQLRNDAPAECKARFANDADFAGYKPLKVGDYDSESHLNYCANMYRRPIALTEGDKCALQTLYPIKGEVGLARKPNCKG